MVWRCCGFVAGIGLLAASPGLAGTRGGLYDMKALLNEAHPFAASAQRPAPVAMPPARAMPALAPPPPTLRYTPPPPPPSTLPATRLPGPKVSPPSTAGPPAIAPPSPRLAQTRQKGKLLPSPRVAPGGSAPPPRLAAATAEPAPDGWFDRIYLSAGGGAHFPDDIGGNTPAGATYSADMETGFLLRAAAGARVAEMLRAEVEIAYRAADSDSINSGGTRTSGSGDTKITTLMANAYYDWPLGQSFTPYVGGGLGLALVQEDDITLAGQVIQGRDDVEIAYQAILGLWYQYRADWAFGPSLRYLGTGDEDINALGLSFNARLDL